MYITKGMRVSGCCVLADYTFTVGSLQPVGMSLNGSGILVSDLSLGSLVIGENTTVSDLSLALIAQNEPWEEGDRQTGGGDSQGGTTGGGTTGGTNGGGTGGNDGGGDDGDDGLDKD